MRADRPDQNIASTFFSWGRRGGKRASLARAGSQTGRPSLRAACLLLFAAPLSPVPARCQESAQPPAPSVVDAARQARERESQLTKRANVVTNDDLAPQLPSAQPSGSSVASSSKTTSSNAIANRAPQRAQDQAAGCQNPVQAEALTAELQGVQDERDELQTELSRQRPVISDNDLDLQSFRPGNSGMAVGSPPTVESQPEAPARVQEVSLDAKIASLKKALLVACEPPKQASIQRKLDAVEEHLKWAQRQLALDQAAFYLNTNFASDTAGKARLDAEQQNIDALQAEKDLLSDQLAATNPNAPVTQD
jgi:hypothetical protein